MTQESCQTNRPFGIDAESFENPKYLDKQVETLGADLVENYDKKVSCCGGTDMIVTPCQLCQANVEVYQSQINKKHNTKFNMPVVYYNTPMSVAYGGSYKDAGLDGQIIAAKKLDDIARK